jgi:small subunit ribosomal protein S17
MAGAKDKETKGAPKAPAGQAEAKAEKRSARRELIGLVTSDKMNKTVVVQVSHRVKSQAYGKYMTKRVKYKAHSENNEFHVGDKVQIVESRPLSKDKRWRVEKLIEKAREAQ